MNKETYAEKEKRIAEANRGRAVSVAMAAFAPLLFEQRSVAYTKLMQEFRAGKQPQELYHYIAACAAVEDLENNVKMTIKRGEIAAKRETEHG